MGNASSLYCAPHCASVCARVPPCGDIEEQTPGLGLGIAGIEYAPAEQNGQIGEPSAYNVLAMLKTQRPPFTVELIRSGPHWRQLGLTLSPDDDPTYLTVDHLYAPSLISEWNDMHDDTMQVQAGDIILSVDGLAGCNNSMLVKLQASGKGSTLTLLVGVGGAHYRPDTTIKEESFHVPCRYPKLKKHFETLGISDSTPPDAIQRHYRFLARHNHPDKNPDDVEEAKERFQKIATAYAAIKEKLRIV